MLLLRNDSNIGIVGSLNRGLAQCRARWVARMDADDRALPQRLERQLNFVRANPDVLTTSCLAHYIDPHGRRIGATTSDLTTRDDFDRYMAEAEPIILIHPGALIRLDVVVEAGGYRAEFNPAEDIDLWARLSERGLLLVQPEYLMEYRVHAASAMGQFHEKARIKHEWSRLCMIARRSGRPEPTWSQFEREWQHAPIWQRVYRNRRLLAERIARGGRQDIASGRRTAGIGKLALSAMLRPVYSAPRLRSQIRSTGIVSSTPAATGQP
jgi:hypothetical protein